MLTAVVLFDSLGLTGHRELLCVLGGWGAPGRGAMCVNTGFGGTWWWSVKVIRGLGSGLVDGPGEWSTLATVVSCVTECATVVFRYSVFGLLDGFLCIFVGDLSSAIHAWRLLRWAMFVGRAICPPHGGYSKLGRARRISTVLLPFMGRG